jgi:restriction endonuclease
MAAEKWKYFERLVAAIHKAADQGADVRWDEKINGRQFDVTVLFKKGLYEYLTVVECRDYATPVPVGDVEAFVTKAKDAHANCAVIASPKGFQSGAQEVAANHDMKLIQVTESSDVDPTIFGANWGDEIDALSMETVELEYIDGTRTKLPEQPNVMTYYTNHIILQTGSEKRTLNSVLTEKSVWFQRGELGEYYDNALDCPPNTRVVEPDDGVVPLKPIARIHIRTALIRAKTIKGPVLFDPVLLVPDVKVKNVATGEEQVFGQHELPLGINTVFEEGKFYEQPQFSNYYYCDHIDGEMATIFLVESFQLGILFQGEFKQEIQYSKFYIPVTDSNVVGRLQRRLNELKADV